MKNILKGCLGILAVIVLVAMFAGAGKNNKQVAEPSGENLDSLRKCAVMEAADIHNTGIGKKSDNAFNDGRETCESWRKEWGESEFNEAVNTDWGNRKDEEIHFRIIYRF